MAYSAPSLTRRSFDSNGRRKVAPERQIHRSDKDVAELEIPGARARRRGTSNRADTTAAATQISSSAGGTPRGWPSARRSLISGGEPPRRCRRSAACSSGAMRGARPAENRPSQSNQPGHCWLDSQGRQMPADRNGREAELSDGEWERGVYSATIDLVDRLAHSLRIEAADLLIRPGRAKGN